jgi:hypothetical protein
MLDKRAKITCLAKVLAEHGFASTVVTRNSQDHAAYLGCGAEDDQVLEITTPQLDWRWLLILAKKLRLGFCALSGQGFRAIRLESNNASLDEVVPHLALAVAKSFAPSHRADGLRRLRDAVPA